MTTSGGKGGRRAAGCAVLAAVIGLALPGCGTAVDGQVRQVRPGTTVYIDGWDESGDDGDQALVEQKPSGLWVISLDSDFRWQPSDEFQVAVTLDDDGRWIVDPSMYKVGKDHDDCLADGETYVTLKEDTPIEFERDRPRSNDNDDCLDTGEE